MEDPLTAVRIRAVLVPKELTRVDGIIDLVFSATEDIQQDNRSDTEEEARVKEKNTTPVSYHGACVERIKSALETNFLRHSRAASSTPDDRVRLVCAVSKEHEHPSYVSYWYAFHPHQLSFLSSTPDSFVAFGCGSPDQFLLIPFGSFRPWLEEMNKTQGTSRPEITGFLLPGNTTERVSYGR